MFESLESRQLLSNAGFTPFFINASSADDTITLSQSGFVLTVVKNGVTSTHATFYMTGGVTPGAGSPKGISKIVINGFAGNDWIKADASVQIPMEVYGGPGSDAIRGGSSADQLYGDFAAGGNAGNDVIEGGAGNDLLRGNSAGTSYLSGGAGNDTVNAAGANNTIYGGDGNDSIIGSNNNDSIYADGGNDYITANAGSDYIRGGAGNDQIFGGDKADSIWGEAGNDSIEGGSGADYLNGGADNDVLNGNDNKADDIVGGTGNDTADYSKRSEDLTITLDNSANDGATNENDNVHSDIETVLCGSGDDKITGNGFSNRLIGNDGDDIIHGGGGNDTANGGAGFDFLYGDAGNDALFGEGWEDNLYGGAGDDLLDGGADADYLVDIGGGNHDILHGGDNNNGDQLDFFWLDSDSTETSDATNLESSAGHVHRISSFANGVSKELNGQDLPDPGLFEIGDDYSYVAAWDYLAPHRFDGNPLFYYHNPYLTDVRQGALGDCYFLAGLGSIAMQNPDVIKRSIVDLGDGTYAVQYFDEDHHKQFYRVDNELPAKRYWKGYNEFEGTVYADTGNGDDMWVPTMEKAYALFCGGSYDDIHGGDLEAPFDALYLPHTSIDVDDDGALESIKNALAAGKAVTVDTVWGNFEPGDHIVASHAYSVVSVDVVHNTITVRNPWGNDAGRYWMQGADDGLVTYEFSNFQDCTEDFYIATV